MWNCIQILGDGPKSNSAFNASFEKKLDAAGNVLKKVTKNVWGKGAELGVEASELLTLKYVSDLEDANMNLKMQKGVENLLSLSKVLSEKMKTSEIDLNKPEVRRQAILIVQEHLGLGHITSQNVINDHLGHLLDMLAEFSTIDGSNPQSLRTYKGVIESFNSYDVTPEKKTLKTSQLEKNFTIKFNANHAAAKDKMADKLAKSLRMEYGYDPSASGVVAGTGLYYFKNAILHYLMSHTAPPSPNDPKSFNSELLARKNNVPAAFRQKSPYIVKKDKMAQYEVVQHLQGFLAQPDAPAVTASINPINPNSIAQPNGG